MSETRKVVINTCYGGFGLSEAAYEKLIEWGIPVRAYVPQEQDENGRYLPQPANDGEAIFDRDLTADGSKLDDAMRHLGGRYWETWLGGRRDDPRLVRVVEELGKAADGPYAELKVVTIPADVEYEIDEYDGKERIAEAHRTWG